MLTAERIESILAKLPSLSIGVVGDLFLDQYLHIDALLTEPSLETGLDAFQVVEIVNSPGAAGTVLNNLVSLGVGRVKVLSFIGTDGRGFDLKRELTRRGVDVSLLLETPLRHTPTYTKPLISDISPPRELNRLDVKNRTLTPTPVERFIEENLPTFFEEVDALLILDQVSEPECGVITSAVRGELARLGERDAQKLLLADSRARVGLFTNCATKPNVRECSHAASDGGCTDAAEDLKCAARWLMERTQRPVFCTTGEQGIYLVSPTTSQLSTLIPAYPVDCPIDVVGAGDSTSAGIASAWAAGAGLEEAAAFGNLVASITIQQLGTTGTATPAQVRARWQEVQSRQTAP